MPDATVVITTRDRRDELPRAIETALAQEGAAVEVLVVDDGSRDGTSAMVAERYPDVRLDRTEHSLGLIAQRSRAARLARAPIIVSIDDDARLVSPRTVAQTLEDFDDERIGAVAVPFLDVRAAQVTVERQVAPERTARWVTNVYIGTAHALRRELFLELGGYRSAFSRQGEEFELCLRMLAAGRVVRLGRADRLEHHESPRRPTETMVRLATRNDLLRTFYSVPMPQAVPVAGKQIVGTLAMARRASRLRAGLQGLAEAARMAARNRDQRRPVGRDALRVDRELRRRGPLRLETLEPLLPPLDASAPGARLLASESGR